MFEKLIAFIIGRALTRNQKSACICFLFSLIFFVPILVSTTSIELPMFIIRVLSCAGGLLVFSGIVLLFLKE